MRHTRPAAVAAGVLPRRRGRARRSRRSSRVPPRPSGRLPVSLPRSAGSQPFSYLHPILGGPNEITSASSAPTRPFGFGLTYTSFAHAELQCRRHRRPRVSRSDASVRVRNTGSRAGTDVVQLYGARRLRVGHPTGRAAARLRAGRPGCRSRRRRWSSTCRPRDSRSRGARGERIVEPGRDRAVGRRLVRRQGGDRGIELTGAAHVVTAAIAG